MVCSMSLSTSPPILTSRASRRPQRRALTPARGKSSGNQADVADFLTFVGISDPMALRTLTRAHIIAWRKSLEARELAGSTIRRKLSALSALFDYLCEQNAVAGNPVDGVKRPGATANEGSTPALSDAQARVLLDAPPADTLKGLRDRAILATLLYHGMRREELCGGLVHGATRQGWSKGSDDAVMS